MNFVVTGAAGFLGSHLCEELLSRGHEVTGVDSCVIGCRDNISFLMNCPRFKFIEADLCRYPFPSLSHMDGIFHLASPTAPAETYKHPDMTLAVNYGVTEWLLEVAEFHAAKFLFASSVKVSDEHSFGSTYIKGKREGERLCMAADTKIARMGNIYGPRMAADDSRVIPTFLRNVRDGKPLVVWGDGQQVDSFCYVSDLIRGLIMFMLSAERGVVEFGYPDGITVEGLAHTVINTLEVGTSIIYEQPGGGLAVVPLQGAMSNNRTTIALHAKSRKVPDISRARDLFNWTPQTSLPVGIRRTYEYYKTIARRAA